jgi:hypothetical protein
MRATGRSPTTAATYRRFLSASPRRSTTALGCRRRSLHPPRPRTRERRARRAAQDRAKGAEHARRRAVPTRSPTLPSPRDRADSVLTPAHGSRRSSVSTSTTCAYPCARASCASSARASRSARSRSTPSCAPPSPAGWTNAPTGPAPRLFLNQRGARLSVKGAHDIITKVTTAAGLEDDTVTAHVVRHTTQVT